MRDGEDGLVVPIDDQKAMKAAIERLVGDTQLSENLTKNGFSRYEGEFTKAGSVQSYLEFYHQICETA